MQFDLRAIRLTAAVAVLAAILACGGDGEMPDESLKPPGTGWYCVTGAGNEPEVCAREEVACGVEAGLAGELSRMHGQPATPTCAPATTANCLTTSVGGTPSFECYRVYQQCFDRRSELGFPNASMCAPWR